MSIARHKRLGSIFVLVGRCDALPEVRRACIHAAANRVWD